MDWCLSASLNVQK